MSKCEGTNERHAFNAMLAVARMKRRAKSQPTYCPMCGGFFELDLYGRFPAHTVNASSHDYPHLDDVFTNLPCEASGHTPNEVADILESALVDRDVTDDDLVAWRGEVSEV